MYDKKYLILQDKNSNNKVDLSQYSQDQDFIGSIQAGLNDNKLDCTIISKAAFDKLKANADVEFIKPDDTTFIDHLLQEQPKASIIIVKIIPKDDGNGMTKKPKITIEMLYNVVLNIYNDVQELKTKVNCLDTKVDKLTDAVKELQSEAKAHG